jgi:hypothetical protein
MNELQFKKGHRYELLCRVVTDAGGHLTPNMRPDISRARGMLRALLPTAQVLAADAWLVQLGTYTSTKLGPPTNQSNQAVYWPHEQA